MPTKIPQHNPRGGKKARDKNYDATVRRMNPELAAAKKIRNSRRYQKFRAWLKRRWPLCCDPFGDHGDRAEPTAHCHHVSGLGRHPEHAVDPAHCAPVCLACHGKLSGLERAGKETTHLFDAFRQKQTEELLDQ